MCAIDCILIFDFDFDLSAFHFYVFFTLFLILTLLYNFMCTLGPNEKSQNFLSKGMASLCVLNSQKLKIENFQILRPKNIVGPFLVLYEKLRI